MRKESEMAIALRLSKNQIRALIWAVVQRAGRA
jgi:hypothetical protein